MYQPPPNGSLPPSPDSAAVPLLSTSSLPNGVSTPTSNGSTGLHHRAPNGDVIPTSGCEEQSLEALVLALSQQPLEPPAYTDTTAAVVAREKPPKDAPTFEQFFGENTVRELPADMVLEIFYHFTMGELLKLRRVCKAWKTIAENPYLWRVNLQANHISLTRSRLWQLLFDTPLADIHYRYSREVFHSELPTEPRITLGALYESAQQYHLVPRPFNQPGKGHNLDYSTLFLHPENQNLAKLDETVQCLHRGGQHFETRVSILSERARALVPWQTSIAKSDFFKTIPTEHYFKLALYLLSARHIENIFGVLEILKKIQQLMLHRPRHPNETIQHQYAMKRCDILSLLLADECRQNLTGRELLLVDATIFYAIYFLIRTWVQIQPYTQESRPYALEYRDFMRKIDELLNRLSAQDLLTYVEYGYEQSAILIQGLKAHHPGLLGRVNQSILLRAAKNIRAVTGENNDCIVNDPLILNKLDDNHFILIARHVSSSDIPNIFKDGTPFRNRLDSFLTPHGITSFVMRLFESQEEDYIADKYARAALATKAYLDAFSDEQIIYILITIETGTSSYDKLLTNAQFTERLTSNIIFTLATKSHAYLSGLLKFPDLIAKKLTAEHAFLIAIGDVAIESARLFYDHFHSQWSREQLLKLYESLKQSWGFATSDFEKVMAREYGERTRQEQLIIQRQEEQAKKEQAAREQEQRLQEQKEKERQAQKKVVASPPPSALDKIPLRSPYTSSALRKRSTYITTTPKAIESHGESSAFPAEPFDWMTLLIVGGVIIGMGLMLTGVLAWAGVPTVTSALAPLALESGLSLTTTSQLFGAIGFLSYIISGIVGVTYNSERLSNSFQEENKLNSSTPIRIIAQEKPQGSIGMSTSVVVQPISRTYNINREQQVLVNAIYTGHAPQ